MSRTEQLAILIIDDQEEVLDVYEGVLRDTLGHQVETACLPDEGMRHVRNRMFDIVIVDAKITYRGASLGGLILAEEIGEILGHDSVLLMSQFDVRQEVARLGSTLTFLSKPKSGGSFVDWVKKDLLGRIERLIERQYGFVIMPYGNPAIDAWYTDSLVPWMRDAGFEVRRMDEMACSRAINTELLERIRGAHFVVVNASARNPNVYFEAGYAFALSKNTLLFSPSIEDQPFDLRSHQILVGDGRDRDGERMALLRYLHRLRGGAAAGPYSPSAGVAVS